GAATKVVDYPSAQALDDAIQDFSDMYGASSKTLLSLIKSNSEISRATTGVVVSTANLFNYQAVDYEEDHFVNPNNGLLVSNTSYDA
ncbi:hypothetical protein SB847_21370, partial [Bacillus sp. SIMBA_026]|uniref:hypothetical protein n=1 Tax=Bacillus sp. SIMBA_026 TaxID=3085769 RepID=UPI003979A7C9